VVDLKPILGPFFFVVLPLDQGFIVDVARIAFFGGMNFRL